MNYHAGTRAFAILKCLLLRCKTKNMNKFDFYKELYIKEEEKKKSNKQLTFPSNRCNHRTRRWIFLFIDNF